MIYKKTKILCMVLAISIFLTLTVYSFWYDILLQIPMSITPLFVQNFDGNSEDMIETGNWYIDNGKYITTGGVSGFGNQNWKDYIVDINVNIISGRDVSIELRCNDNNCYRVQTDNNYGNILLYKIDGDRYTSLDNVKMYNVSADGWHTWKIIVNDDKIQVFIDKNKFIDYTDTDKPYLKGNVDLRSVSTTVEYDHIYIYGYKPENRINDEYRLIYIMTMRGYIIDLTYILIFLYILSSTIFNISGNISILTGLSFLIVASLTEEMKRIFSDSMAIYGYYFLVIGVSLIIFRNIKEDKKRNCEI